MSSSTSAAIAVQAERVIEFPEREQPDIGGDGRAVEFELQPAVERDAQSRPSASPIASSSAAPSVLAKTPAIHSRIAPMARNVSKHVLVERLLRSGCRRTEDSGAARQTQWEMDGAVRPRAVLSGCIAKEVVRHARVPVLTRRVRRRRHKKASER
jgi:hypothetical protein